MERPRASPTPDQRGQEVTKGINGYEGKDKRRQRRRNHVARDLHKMKYHQRVVKPKRQEPPEIDLYEQDGVFEGGIAFEE